VLSRGYSIATYEDGKVISSTKDATADKEFSIRLSDGSVKGKFI